MVRFKHYCYRMLGLFLVLLPLTVLPACWVVSIEGLDESEWPGSLDHDRTFEPALVGDWLMPSRNCVITISITADNHEYVARQTGDGEKCSEDDKKEVHYRSKLYKLDQHLFLDVTARREDVCEVCVPVHWIFLVTIEKDVLTLVVIDSGWLREGLESKSVGLATLSNETEVITATPKELKDFCRKYSGNKEAFRLIPQMIFKRK